MKRILIITAAYGRDSSVPCGKDMCELAEKLAKAQHDVTVFTTSKTTESVEVQNGVGVVKIQTLTKRREALAEEYSKKCNLIKKLYLRWRLHVVNHKISDTYFMGDLMSLFALKKRMNQQKEKYDLLISVSYPFYIQEYAKQVVKTLKIKRWIPYMLDPHADNLHCFKDTRENRIKKEKELFKKATNIFAVEEFVTHAKLSPIIHYKEKVQYIPTHLIVDNTKYCKANNSDMINFVYTGIFYKDIRNPENLLRYFDKMPNNYILHLYSKGCEDVIKRYKEILGNRLQVNDFILDPEKYNEMIGKADFLIDVGNTVSNQVPSKILTYCSFGKPIIHFKNCQDEVVGDKFKAYPLFNVIDYTEDVEVVKNEIKKIVEKDFGKTVDYGKIKANFADCTVESVVEKIEKILGDK